MMLKQGVEILDRYMTKIEDTAREFSLFEKNISSANLGSYIMRNARVTARHNIQYAADDVSGVLELVSTHRETLSALQSLYAGPLLRRFSRRIWKKMPKHNKILKLYGEANVGFS
jgi:hypothetical protein